jgi:hypothetical protein
VIKKRCVKIFDKTKTETFFVRDTSLPLRPLYFFLVLNLNSNVNLETKINLSIQKPTIRHTVSLKERHTRINTIWPPSLSCKKLENSSNNV